MLVYGDAEQTENAQALAAGIGDRLRALAATPAGLDRHAALAHAFVDGGMLLQGLADSAFAEDGRDRLRPDLVQLQDWLLRLAAALLASRASGFKGPDPSPNLLPPAGIPHRPIVLRRPEGFAYYAVYPESYGAAAKPFANGDPLHAIGIRSIGTALAAMVAAGSGGRFLGTVRPVGSPSDRTIAADLHVPPAGLIAIADEGPGLSGSSFAATAAWLAERGVAWDRMHFFPSHENPPGPLAGDRHRATWTRVRRHAASFEKALSPARRLPAWASAFTGAPRTPLAELSAGRWREHLRFAGEPPPAFASWERRKYLVRSENGDWLLKFAGLGRFGADTHRRARQLSEAGWSPPDMGLAYGFSITRWHSDATPGDFGCLPPLDLAARYLAFRDAHFPASPGQGAGAERLLEMLRRNASLVLGEAVQRASRRFEPAVRRASREAKPVFTDNRLHRWEWIRTSQGRWFKTDASDHAAAHDLIGCQDVSWDAAGLLIEFDLGASETQRLLGLLAEALGRQIAPDVLEFMQACYCAFQLGLCTLALAAAPGDDARKVRRERERYVQALARLMMHGGPDRKELWTKGVC